MALTISRSFIVTSLSILHSLQNTDMRMSIFRRKKKCRQDGIINAILRSYFLADYNNHVDLLSRMKTILRLMLG